MTSDPAAVNARWGRTIVSALANVGVEAACLAPGSRSTPLTVAFVEHADVDCYSHLDERSAAYFALGRSKRTGVPVALVCTSGTAAANFHPAVVEAHHSRTPLVVCTADRPPELRDSGANQTIDQVDLYGDAVRRSRTLPEPGADARKVRSLGVAVSRAVDASTRPPAGPVHLNVPFRKPLTPPTDGGVAEWDPDREGQWGAGRPHGPPVSTTGGRATLSDDALASLVATTGSAERGLIVAGPADPEPAGRDTAVAVAALAEATGFPVLADPLSGLRYGPHVDSTAICGGYDAYLEGADALGWPDPDLVLRFGAAPTSATLGAYVADTAPRQLLIDAGGGWREPTFTATDVVEADPGWLAAELADRVSTGGRDEWADRFRRAEANHWRAVEDEGRFFEGAVAAAVVDDVPGPATVFVSNSMPIRDLDRFGRPNGKALTVLGNRGASGVDGIVSTALGAGSVTDEPLVLVTGDLAYYHDMNGLLALSRCGVDATIVVVENDGGGIFHMLPIAEHATFEEWFVTPHGLDFSPTAELYDLEFTRTETLGDFRDAFGRSVGEDSTRVLSVESDAARSFAVREDLRDRVVASLGG